MVEGTTPAAAGGAEAWQLSPRLGQRCQQGQVPAVVLGDLTLVRPVGWAGIPVVAVSPQADDVAFRSRYVDGWCVVPGYLPPHDQATVRLLDQLGAALQPLAGGARIPLIYGSDAQLELLYRHREALERRFLFLLNQEDLGWALNDKGHFLALCQKAGVPVPRTFIPGFTRVADGAPGDLDALTPPLVVKPRTKSDWKDIQQALFQSKAKARVFPDAGSLLAHPGFAGVRDRLVVQEYIEAPVTNLRSFHGFADAAGQLLAWFSGHKLHTWPPVAGESALLQLDHDREVEDLGKETADRLELRGPFKLDLIRDPRDGRLYVLEVNARFNLWHHLGAAHGVNLPAVAHEYLVYGRVPLRPPEYQPRVRWQNVYRDLKALRDLGPAGVAPSLWTLFRPTVRELFAWSDPAPFLAQLSAMAGRYLPGEATLARYGVIADVHGNLQALEAVLRALDAQAIQDILCLGDLVGYNADSDACVGLLHERRAVSIAGNHDLIALGQLGFDFCAPNPEFSLRRTRRRLGAGTRALLRTLPRSLLSADGVTLIHGALDDPTRYLHTGRDVAGEAEPLRQRWPAARLCFFGHTHVPALYRLHGADVRHLAPLPEQRLDDDAFWFINPGSVDAARRGDGLAQYAVFDSGTFSLSLHRVPYDHAGAEASALAGGYRMGQVQRRLLSARRLLRRARHKAEKTIRRAVG